MNKTVWDYYDGIFGDNGIMDFARRFNKKYRKSEMSPPAIKVRQLRLEKMKIIFFILTIMGALVAIAGLSVGFAIVQGPKNPASQLVAGVSVCFFAVGLLLFAISMVKGFQYENKELEFKQYINDFELKGLRFGQEILSKSPPSMSLDDRIRLVLKVKACMVLENEVPNRDGALRDELANHIDSLVECNMIQQSEIKKFYDRAYDDARRELEKRETETTAVATT